MVLISERSADESGRPGRCGRPTNGGDICSIDQNSFDADDRLRSGGWLSVDMGGVIWTSRSQGVATSFALVEIGTT